MTIIWNSSLDTGHRQIDLQHQELVELLNELVAAHLAGSDDTALQEILPRLSSYVLFHFGTEEMLMSELPAQHEHAKSHREAHHAFTARIDALRAQIAVGEYPPLGPLIDYLKTWLIEHIMRTDRELVTLLTARPPAHR